MVATSFEKPILVNERPSVSPLLTSGKINMLRIALLCTGKVLASAFALTLIPFLCATTTAVGAR